MIEHEKKVLLTEREYNYLFGVFSPMGKTVMQVNRYFDTVDWQNHAQGITYRVREKNGIYTATEKQHCLGSCDCSRERSFSVNDPFDISPFQMDGLVYQGLLITVRTEWSPEEGVLICLDKNMYLETEDYELEIEYADEEAAALWMHEVGATLMADDVLNSHTALLSRMNCVQSKSKRFFERKIKLKRGK